MTDVNIFINAVDGASQVIDTVNVNLAGMDEAGKKAGEGMDAAEKGSKGLDSRLKGLTSTLKQVGAGAAIAGLTVAKIFEMGEAGAQFDRLKTSGEELAAGLGSSLDEIISKLDEAAQGAISDSDLIGSANAAMMLGLGANADQLANLMEVAALRGRAMGLSTTQAFNDIVRGIGRMSPMILDNLGIMIDAESRYSAYAETMGIAADEIDGVMKRQILLNGVLEEGNALLEQSGGLAEDDAVAFEQLRATFANIATEIQGKFAPGLAEAARTLVLLLTWEKQLDQLTLEHAEHVLQTADSYEKYVNELIRAGVVSGQITEEEGKLIATLAGVGDGMQELREELNFLTVASDGFLISLFAQADAAGKLSKADIELLRAQKALEGDTFELTGALEDMGKTEEEIIEIIKLGMNITEDKTAAIGLETQAVFERTQAVKEFTGVLTEENRLLIGAGAAAEEKARINRELAESELEVAAAIENIKFLIDGPVGKAIDAFGKKYKTLSATLQETKSKIRELENRKYLTAAQKQELEELKVKLGETKQAIDDEALAFEENTAQIMFNIASRLILASTDMTPEEQLRALAVLGEQLGLIDADTAELQKQTLALTQAYIDGEISLFEYTRQLALLQEAAALAAKEGISLAEAIARLEDKTVTVTTHYVSTGTPSGADGATPLARGGPLTNLAVVGEEGRELVVNGYVIPHPQTEAILGGLSLAGATVPAFAHGGNLGAAAGPPTIIGSGAPGDTFQISTVQVMLDPNAVTDESVLERMANELRSQMA